MKKSTVAAAGLLVLLPLTASVVGSSGAAAAATSFTVRVAVAGRPGLPGRPTTFALRAGLLPGAHIASYRVTYGDGGFATGHGLPVRLAHVYPTSGTRVLRILVRDSKGRIAAGGVRFVVSAPPTSPATSPATSPVGAPPTAPATTPATLPASAPPTSVPTTPATNAAATAPDLSPPPGTDLAPDLTPPPDPAGAPDLAPPAGAAGGLDLTPPGGANTGGAAALPQSAWREQAGSHGVGTFTNYHNASGPGDRIAAMAWVDVSCKVKDGTIPSVNPDGYWYRIASSPWNNAYYAPANTFYNGDPVGGPYTHNTDLAVSDC